MLLPIGDAFAHDGIRESHYGGTIRVAPQGEVSPTAHCRFLWRRESVVALTTGENPLWAKTTVEERPMRTQGFWGPIGL